MQGTSVPPPRINSRPVIGPAKIGDPMSLVKNIRNAQKKGTANSKKNSTVSNKAYKDMQKGWPNSKKNKAKKK